MSGSLRLVRPELAKPRLTHPLLRLIRQIGPWRLIAAVLLMIMAVITARASWQLAITRDFERALYNYRLFLTAPAIDQDQRIVEVVYNDEVLAALGRRSPLDRGLLAKALTNLDRYGAKAIGIDILIDQKQPEDEALIAAMRAMKTPTFLAYTTADANKEQMAEWQQQFLDGFQQQLAGTGTHKALIRILSDSDNVVRSWPASPPGLPPLLALAMAGTKAGSAPPMDGDVSLRFRVPKGFIRLTGARQDPDGSSAEPSDIRPEFGQLGIDLFANDQLARAFGPQIAGRYVLVGGALQDNDLWDTPVTRITGHPIWGLDVHAIMLAQLLDAAWLRVPPSWALWTAALLIVATGAGTALAELRTYQMVPLIAGEVLLIAGLPILAQYQGWDTQHLPAAGWAIGWVLAFAGASAAARGMDGDQRRFAQSALGRYLPRDIAREILRDPERLRLSGEKRTIIALFTDLEGFTRLSHAISPEMVAYLINGYLDTMCAIVLAHGGTVDKFVGDAVVAFWGAPLAKPDDADRAVAAAIAMYQAGEHFRRNAPEGVPPIGRTRIGLHCGEAVVGNFGGEGRIQYTAFGDAMNTAARLEGANKYLRTTALVSGSVVKRLTGHAPLRPMGRIMVSGVSTALEVYEPVPELSTGEQTLHGALYAAADRGDPDSLGELLRFSRSRPDDQALDRLVDRLEKAGPGGTYVLESK